MDILKILKAHNLEGEQAEAIQEAIKGDIHKSFIPKAQYNKKVQELDAVKTSLDDANARAEAPNEYEAKYNDISKELESLRGEYEAYKNDVNYKDKKNSINSKVTQMLNDNGYTNNKVVELLLKNLDYDKINLDGDKLEGFEFETFTKGFEEFKTVSNIEGTTPTTPPTNVNNEIYTREALRNMSAEQINANWDAISNSLKNI